MLEALVSSSVFVYFFSHLFLVGFSKNSFLNRICVFLVERYGGSESGL